MIADKLSNWRKYNLGPKFAKAFEHLEKLSADAPLGRVDIDGPGLYISIAEYETASKAPTFLEVHRKYVDIQMTLSGEELLGWTTNASFPVDKPYDEAKDCEFLKVPAKPLNTVEIDKATFAIFFPDDAHIGKLAPHSGPARIKKLVVKVGI
jgi:YhcH/YjgK/YiaL family protein